MVYRALRADEHRHALQPPMVWTIACASLIAISSTPSSCLLTPQFSSISEFWRRGEIGAAIEAFDHCRDRPWALVIMGYGVLESEVRALSGLGRTSSFTPQLAPKRC